MPYEIAGNAIAERLNFITRMVPSDSLPLGEWYGFRYQYMPISSKKPPAPNSVGNPEDYTLCVGYKNSLHEKN